MPALAGWVQWSPAAHGAVSILFNGGSTPRAARGGNSHDGEADKDISTPTGHWPFPQTLREQDEEQAKARQNFKNAFPFSRTDGVQERRFQV